MESSLAKKDAKSLERDRLSELPNEIVVHILSFLPIEHAVQTMLVRRFGNLWTLVHTLDFRELPRSPSSIFLRNVLLLHQKLEIKKFVLKLGDLVCCDEATELQAEVDMLMRFVSSRKTKELVLDLGMLEFPALPHFMFKSNSLTILDLLGAQLALKGPVSLGALRTFRLRHSYVCGESISILVSGCPVLEEVIFEENPVALSKMCFSSRSIKRLKILATTYFYTTSKIKIDCPNLKILDFEYGYGLENVEYINVPTVQEVILYGEYVKNPEGFKKLLEAIKHAEVFIYREDFKILEYYLGKNLALPKNAWKLVEMKFGSNDKCCLGVFNLLTCSTCLEELIMHVDHGTSNVLSPDSCEVTCCNALSQVVSSPCVILPSLRRITMYGYWYHSQCQLQLSEVLLKIAINLDEFVIISDLKHRNFTKGMQFVRQMLSFPRASTKARVLFTCKDGSSTYTHCFENRFSREPVVRPIFKLQNDSGQNRLNTDRDALMHENRADCRATI